MLKSLLEKQRGEFDRKIAKHKEQACAIADTPEYDEVNMTRHVENPLIRSLVLQHIDFVRELNLLKSESLSSSQSVIKAVREIVEGKKMKFDPDTVPRGYEDPSTVKGYNAALQDIIKSLDESL